MFFLASHGYRVITHDRLAHGRSRQSWDGHDMDTYADDLATLIDTLELTEITLVGHSTGGGQAFPGRGHQTAQEEEVRRLKRELEVVRQERDI